MKLNIQKLQQGNKVASYLQHKQDSVRNQALINFNNLKEAIVPKIPNPQSKEEWERSVKDDYKFFARDYLNTKNIRDKYRAWRMLQDTERQLDKGYPAYVNGPTCINTVTGCYPHRVSGNQTFAANPNKYGFVEISEAERLPGDIVQDWIYGIPIHAMLYSGDNKFNYSTGTSGRGSLVRNGNYPTWGKLRYFRFVGTDEDKKKWENEAKY